MWTLEMSQWLKILLLKHEDLRSGPQPPHKLLRVWQMPIMQALGKHLVLEAHWSANPAKW